MNPDSGSERDGAQPLLAGPIHGFRRWSIDCSGHGSAPILVGFGDFAWVPGGRPTRAECYRGHDAPRPDCECGLYARHFHDLERSELSAYGAGSGEVTGIVAAWGTIEVHRSGFRAQYARPVALFAPAVDLLIPGGDGVAMLAERYELELIEGIRVASIGAGMHRRWPGIDAATADGLVERARPSAPRSAPSLPAPPPRGRAARFRSLLGSLVEVVFALLSIGLTGLFWVGMAAAILLAIFGEDEPRPGPLLLERAVAVRDQGFETRGRRWLHWAIVSNEGGRALVGVRMRGEIVARDGSPIVRLDPSSHYWRSAQIAAGEEALVLDRGRVPRRERERLGTERVARFAVEPVGRSRLPTRGAPIAISRTRVNRSRCRVEARVRARAPIRRAEIDLIARDAGKLYGYRRVRLSGIRAAARTRALVVLTRGACRHGGLRFDAFPVISERMLSNFGVRPARPSATRPPTSNGNRRGG